MNMWEQQTAEMNRLFSVHGTLVKDDNGKLCRIGSVIVNERKGYITVLLHNLINKDDIAEMPVDIALVDEMIDRVKESDIDKLQLLGFQLKKLDRGYSIELK